MLLLKECHFQGSAAANHAQRRGTNDVRRQHTVLNILAFDVERAAAETGSTIARLPSPEDDERQLASQAVSRRKNRLRVTAPGQAAWALVPFAWLSCPVEG